MVRYLKGQINDNNRSAQIKSQISQVICDIDQLRRAITRVDRKREKDTTHKPGRL